MRFDEFFSKIPSVPLRSICKNMKIQQLIPLSLSSNHWRDAIKFYKSQEKGSLNLSITDKKVIIDLESWVVPTSWYSIKEDMKKVQIQFLEATDKNDKEFSDKTIKITNANIEPMAQDFIRLLFSMFSSLKIDNFSLNLTEKSPDSTLLFLITIPCFDYQSISLQWPKQSIYYFSTFKVFLETTLVIWELIMNVEFDKVDEKIEFKRKNQMSLIKIRDATCFSGNSLEKIGCCKGEFGPNQWTSADFNNWFRNWKEGKIGGRTEKITFVISDNQEIKMEDVMEGLDAQKWDPQVRDKTFISSDRSDIYELTPQYVIPMEDAMDITNVYGRLGSVKISRNELIFIVWWWSSSGFECRFPASQRLKSLEEWLDHYEEELKEKLEMRKRLMEGNEEVGKVEEDIGEIEEKLKEVREQLDKFRNEYV